MTLDALQKEIVLGKRYGYSRYVSGITRIVFGTVIEIKDGKVVLDDIEVQTHVWVSNGNQSKPDVEFPKLKRTLASVQLFPI